MYLMCILCSSPFCFFLSSVLIFLNVFSWAAVSITFFYTLFIFLITLFMPTHLFGGLCLVCTAHLSFKGLRTPSLAHPLALKIFPPPLSFLNVNAFCATIISIWKIENWLTDWLWDLSSDGGLPPHPNLHHTQGLYFCISGACPYGILQCSSTMVLEAACPADFKGFPVLTHSLQLWRGLSMN